jgi:hypothetical protein
LETTSKNYSLSFHRFHKIIAYKHQSFVFLDSFLDNSYFKIHEN